MPPVHFINRSNPRSPVPVTVSGCRRGPHVTTGSHNEPLCFSETSVARPVKLSHGVRKALTKRLHQSGLHGQYESLSDNGLVALAHARQLAKNADGDASGPSAKPYDSIPPVNTSTKLNPAPSQKFSQDQQFQKRLAAHTKRITAAKYRDEKAGRAQTMPHGGPR